MAFSYPGGTWDTVHYADHVFKSAEDALIQFVELYQPIMWITIKTHTVSIVS